MIALLLPAIVSIAERTHFPCVITNNFTFFTKHKTHIMMK